MNWSSTEPRQRELWIDVRPLGSDVGKLLDSIDGGSFSAFLASPEQCPLLSGRGRVAVAHDGDGNADVADAHIRVFPDARAAHGRVNGAAAALFSTIASESDLNRFAAELAASSATYGIVDLKDETNIPLELLIAWFQKTPVKIFKQVRDVEQADIALRTLEHGADGVVLQTATPAELRRAAALVDVEKTTRLELTEWEVTKLEYLGSGHRALIDTVSLLTQTEGMLVGSTCNAFAMMCSETHYLPYMPLRPFRVNAAAIHSYLLGPGNKTNYLGDVESGMSCLVVDTSGKARAVAVGRVKIERRPLLRIAFRDGDLEGNLVVQADWHVRIMEAAGKPLNVTHCKPGTKLVGWRTDAARHCGNPIAEHLIER